MTFNVLLLKSAIKLFRRSVSLDKRKIGTACSSFIAFVWNIWIWIPSNMIDWLYFSIKLKITMNLMLMNILFLRKMEFPMTIISGHSKLGSITWYFITSIMNHDITIHSSEFKSMACFLPTIEWNNDLSEWYQCVIINSVGTLSKAAGLFINSSLNYKTSPSEKPGQGGFPFAFWQLLHYITVQSIDRDARIGILPLKSYTLKVSLFV